MPRIWITRLVLAALPFCIYFLWRQFHVRRGRDVGSTPWGWLIGAGALLAGLSIMASVAFQHDNTGRTYVPAQTQPDGSVRPGHFE
jgi:hypothetical protein